MDDKAQESATRNLLASFGVRRSRASLFKGAAAAGAAVAGLTMLPGVAGAAGRTRAAGTESDADDSIKTIFTVARTAERLAITFYTNGVRNAQQLGLRGAELAQIKAALIEEQIHELFFAANGGVPLASTFSFPHAGETFKNRQLFIATQQQLEGAFDSAFIAAVEEFALLGQPVLARIACQIAMIESEHRALGRDIGNLEPADNWAFAPKLVEAVGDAPAVLADAGYLSPKGDNSYAYAQVMFNDQNNDPLGLYAVGQTVMYQAPFAAPEDGEDGEDTK